MGRRRFGREFKIEAVRLIKDRGVSAAQASRDLDVHENLLRKWVKLFSADPAQAFPGHGQMKPDQLEIEGLRRKASTPMAADIRNMSPARGRRRRGCEGEAGLAGRLRSMADFHQVRSVVG